jgi:hypothetical protein
MTDTRRPKHRAEAHDRVRRLARLLTKAAPLIELVNSPDTPAEDRAFLRELVGPQRYVDLAANLYQMRSWRAWEIAQAEDETTR